MSDILEEVLPDGPDVTPDDKDSAQWWWSAVPKPVSVGSNTPSDQWLRRMELTVYSAAGAAGPASGGLRLSALRINFQIKKQTSESPNTLFARVYNLAPATMNK